MKRFSFKLFLFLLPFILLFSASEIYLSNIQNSYNKKKRSFENQLNDIQVLVLGSSHAVWGINPASFAEKGFNLANVAQSTFYDTKLIHRYADKLPKLKLVIMPISYISLYYNIINSKDEYWRDYYYSYFWHINYPGLPLFESRRYSLLMLYTPAEAFKFLSGKLPMDMAPELSENGYIFIDSAGHTKAISDSAGMERVELMNSWYHTKDFIQTVDLVKEMISYLNERKIKIIFLTTPAYHTFSDHADASKLAKNHEVIQEFCQLAHSTYFDYFTDPRFNLDDFMDNDHLSYIGAAKFSRIVDSEIVEPYFKLNPVR